jgi:hypothetical protein
LGFLFPRPEGLGYFDVGVGIGEESAGFRVKFGFAEGKEDVTGGVEDVEIAHERLALLLRRM